MRFYLAYWSLVYSCIPVFVFACIQQYWWLAIVTGILSIVCRQDFMRVVVRVGYFGAAPLPCSSKMLLAKFRGTRPTVVGRGWGFYLQRMSAQDPVLSMRRFVGKGEGKYEGWWAAGTTIETVLRHMSLTFPSHPSFSDISIGSWFAMACHGSGGDAGKPSSSVFQCAEVVCFDPPNIETVDSYRRLRDIFDKQGHNCAITWVRFHNLVENRTVQKRAFNVTSVDDARRWLSSGAILRVLFVGAARDGIGIRWENPYEETDHIDPHCCSKHCTFYQADLCSVCCGCKDPYRNWKGKTTLKEANKWVPYIFPFESVLAYIGGYKNFELAFRCDMTPVLLDMMVKKLRDMHKMHGGRTEIRFGSSVVFWDVSMRQYFEAPFHILNELNIRRLAYHPSKVQLGISIIPVVPIGDIYFNRQPRNITF